MKKYMEDTTLRLKQEDLAAVGWNCMLDYWFKTPEI